MTKVHGRPKCMVEGNSKRFIVDHILKYRDDWLYHLCKFWLQMFLQNGTTTVSRQRCEPETECITDRAFFDGEIDEDIFNEIFPQVEKLWMMWFLLEGRVGKVDRRGGNWLQSGHEGRRNFWTWIRTRTWRFHRCRLWRIQKLCQWHHCLFHPLNNLFQLGCLLFGPIQSITTHRSNLSPKEYSFEPWKKKKFTWHSNGISCDHEKNKYFDCLFDWLIFVYKIHSLHTTLMTKIMLGNACQSFAWGETNNLETSAGAGLCQET